MKLRETLLHMAAHPDPVSMHCAIPAQLVEEMATDVARIEAERDALRATVERVMRLQRWDAAVLPPSELVVRAADLSRALQRAT